MSLDFPISHIIAPSISSSQSSFNQAFQNIDEQNYSKIKKSIILSASVFTTQFYDPRVIQKQLKNCPDEITFEKYTEICEQAQVNRGNTSAEWVFKLYDKDAKGYIDRADLIRASEITGVQLAEQEIAQMLKAQNPMVDGKVYFDDFIEVMNPTIEYE